jgi:predicted TIM-barrel fold metal-dependent hydrolase
MSAIWEAVTGGRPVDVPFIDVHGHFGPWPETVIPYAMDYGRVIGEMDRYGCDQVWMSTSNPGYSDDISTKNDYVLHFAKEYPDRIIPYCTLSANTPDRNAGELKRCLGRGRCIGVKMHRYHQPAYTMRSGFLQPILEILAENRLVYINHSYEDTEALCWALEKYPDLMFMAGHFSPPINDLALRYANLRDCTCAALSYRSVGEEVQRLGRSDTMLVGSDFSLFQLGFGIGMIAYADISEHDKENILGLNAIHLLRRTSWFNELKFSKPIG